MGAQGDNDDGLDRRLSVDCRLADRPIDRIGKRSSSGASWRKRCSGKNKRRLNAINAGKYPELAINGRRLLAIKQREE